MSHWRYQEVGKRALILTREVGKGALRMMWEVGKRGRTDRWTDRETETLIQGGLCNLSVPPGKLNIISEPPM